MGLDDLGKRAGDLSALTAGEEAGEVALDGVDVVWRSLAEGGAAGGGDRGEAGTAVGGVGLAADEAGSDDLVDEAADSGARQDGALGEVMHAELAARGCVELEQDVVPGQADDVRGLHVAFYGPKDAVLGHQQGPPGGNRIVVVVDGNNLAVMCVGTHRPESVQMHITTVRTPK